MSWAARQAPHMCHLGKAIHQAPGFVCHHPSFAAWNQGLGSAEACQSLSVTWVGGASLSITEKAVPWGPHPAGAWPTLSMDALRKLSNRRRASAREQELMTTDVSVESSSSWNPEAETLCHQD